MRRAVAVIAIAGASTFTPAIAHAQDAGTETTVVTSEVTDTVQRPVTSEVTDTVTRTVTSVEEVDTDDDDDDDKTGLWGLLGLLGLAGLLGLLKRRHTDDTTYTAGTVRGDTTPRGSTGTKE